MSILPIVPSAADFDDIHIIKEFSGHSGCRIFLVESNGVNMVRKVSSAPEYNARLESQAEKQGAYRSDCARAPTVLKSGFIGGLFFFDMEYVRAFSFAEKLLMIPASEADGFVSNLFDFIDIKSDSAADGVQIIKKIDSLRHLQGKFSVLKPVFEYLDGCQWQEVCAGYCHGDLTFENILFSETGDFYLIDFLDSFFDGAAVDIAKILQDLEVHWSYRNKNLTLSDEIKLSHARDFFIQELGARSEVLLKKGYDMLVLNLVRIYPYVTDISTRTFIDKSLCKLLK